jgi:hypothetical protein
MNAENFHPFWKGVFHEFGKQSDLAALPAQAAELATSSPEAAAGVAGAGLLTGIGAVALKRKLFKGKGPTPKKTKAKAAPEPPPPQGFSGKALLGTGLVGAAGGYYYGQKKD